VKPSNFALVFTWTTVLNSGLYVDVISLEIVVK
jgi:hypothetical protein